MEIEVESLNVFRAVSGQAVGCQEGRNLIVRESKDNLEVQRSAFATDDLEAEVTDLFPAGVSLFQFFVEEVFLEITALECLDTKSVQLSAPSAVSSISS